MLDEQVKRITPKDLLEARKDEMESDILSGFYTLVEMYGTSVKVYSDPIKNERRN